MVKKLDIYIIFDIFEAYSLLGNSPLLMALDTSSFIIQFSKVLTRHGNVFHYSWLETNKEVKSVSFYGITM
jgi:hypothetical protein